MAQTIILHCTSKKNKSRRKDRRVEKDERQEKEKTKTKSMKMTQKFFELVTTRFFPKTD